MNILFEIIFHTIFTDSGEIKACGRDGCRVLIDRLPGNVGNAKTGHLNMPAAYVAGKSLLGL